MTAATTESEVNRIKKIHEYEQAVPDVQSSFKNIIDLLTGFFDTYYAGIHFLDQQKQWIEASSGIGLPFMYIEDSICKYTLQADEPLSITDLSHDSRTRDLFYVTNPPKFQSYVATPLHTPEDHPVGTVCLMDKEPRTFENKEIETLKHVADEVIDKFELYRKNQEFDAQYRKHKVQLQEIHHRLKNNLHLISGLIELERMRTSNNTFSTILEDIQKRIKSIATLHQHLYETDLLENLELKPYIEDLIEDVCNGMANEGTSIECSITGDEPQLSEQKMVYVGLLLNELITNSLKHAFKESSKGTIRLNITEQQNTCIIHYSDDGVGLPDNFDLGDEDSLGGRLIQNFLTQLDGHLKSYNDSGAQFQISFPMNEPTLDL